MHDAYCLTVREAAEMAGVEVKEVMSCIAFDTDVGNRVGDAWRVDPDRLASALNGKEHRAAA